jgi:hypothetical protein
VRRINSALFSPAQSPFQNWLEADAVAGPQRAYRLARKLPEQLRIQGRTAAARADWALAHTLFWMGRFEESRALLACIRSDAITAEASARFNPLLLIPAQLGWTLALLGETQQALEQAEHALYWAQNQPQALHLARAWGYQSLLHCFLDTPEAALACNRQAQTAAAAADESSLLDSAKLLEYWALSRLGQTTDETAAQTALASLRRHSPAHEAQAFSLYAQALFHQSPPYAVTQLDAALDMNARFGLHHWEARLLLLKSRSLDASGQLSEASRFHRLAKETAQRQGARLFLNDIEGIESRTQASQ